MVRAKRRNAAGLPPSGLEMAQNSMRISWTREEVDARLFKIMKSIHAQLLSHRGENTGLPGNYVNGANIASFLKVAARDDGSGAGIASEP
jgi:glutamate dehydrogenase (NADP+)